MVEFVSYDGEWPNLCRGTLVLKINGKKRVFPPGSLCSGGSVWFSDNWEPHIEKGLWSVSVPDDLKDYTAAIEKCVNENVEHGCCGGCV